MPRWPLPRAAVAALIAIAPLSGCISFPPPAPALQAPAIEGDVVIVRDGARLGLEVTRPSRPRAIVIAVHGMNDYAGHFRDAAAFLASEHDIAVYAYDQRGFGRSPNVGHWPGEGQLADDLTATIEAVRRAHPGLPVFALGHSMGAAVILAAAKSAPLDVDGAILAAPAAWGGSQLPIAYRVALFVSASVAPGKTLTGERAGRQASDNIEALREMYRDPLVIKPTRLDAIYGVARLMGKAYDASDEVGGRVLTLIGERDEIIPLRTMQRVERRLCGAVEARTYPEGWHLLLRDLQARRVYEDLAAWIKAVGGNASSAAGPVGFGPAALACAAKVR